MIIDVGEGAGGGYSAGIWELNSTNSTYHQLYKDGVLNRTLTNNLYGQTITFQTRANDAADSATQYIDTVYINKGALTLSKVAPANATETLASYILLNASINSSNFTPINLTFNTFFINNTLFSSTTNSLTGTGFNYTTLNLTNLIIADYIWNVNSCLTLENTTLQCFNSEESNFTFSRKQALASTFNYNVTSAETANESFNVNLSTNGSSITNAWINYNGTTSVATVTNTAGNNYNLSSYFDIPTGYPNLNRTFNFTYTLGGTNYSTTNQQQNVTLTYFALCNATYTNDFLNITFKDEVSSAYINASITSGTFDYYLGSGSVNKTLSYNSAGVNNYNYTFCATPTTRTFNVLPEVTYKQGSDYPQRIWQPSVQSYNSSVFEQILYLLNSADGLYVTFQVINSAQEPLNNVFSNSSRDISGTTTITGTGNTDAAGSITYWLNPDYLHTFYFVLAGYDTFVTSLFPTQSSYTVTMGGSSANGTTYDHNRGISYNITPTNNSLENNTLYNFSFNLTSTYWTVQSFGFTLTDENGTVLNASNSSSSGGLTSAFFNTTNYSQISMNYFYYVNGSFSNFTHTWFIYDNSGAGFGLGTFFTHLGTFVSQDLFGLDNFGLALICFVLIFVGTGILSFKFGVTSPATIAGFMFFLTAFLNVGVDIIPIGYSPLRFFPTVLVGLIFAGMLLKEATE